MAQVSQYERFAFIEMLAYWQGYVRNSDLVTQFEITRQQVYKDISAYLALYPKQLTKQANGSYRLVADAKHYYFDGSLDCYLSWLQTTDFNFATNKQTTQAYTLTPPARGALSQVIATLTQAIRQQQRVDVGYVSLSNPETDGRIFSPHCFVKAGGRWHVRGYCEKSQGYRDLVLSRFRGEAVIEGKAIYGAEQDEAWQTYITLVLAPDPRLTAEQQAVLTHDFQMQDGKLQLNTRAALADYLLKELQINTKYLDGSPEAQQLVLVNRNDIKQWLFSA